MTLPPVKYLHQKEQSPDFLSWEDNKEQGCQVGTPFYYGNILWPDRREPTVEQMEAFRALGYWASCYPEGDGITMKTQRGQSPETVKNDIEKVFGWTIAN